MKRFLFIALCVMYCYSGLTQQQNVDIISRINEIKLDSLILYGESTEKYESTAAANALKDLMLSFDNYKEFHEGVLLDSTKIGTYKHFRGKNIRVFKYVHVDSLSTKKSSSAVNLEQLEKELASLNTWKDVTNLIDKLSISDKVSYGFVDLSSDDDIIHNSFIFIIRGFDENIVEIYSPVQSDSRKAIKSATISPISYKPRDKVYWLTIDK